MIEESLKDLIIVPFYHSIGRYSRPIEVYAYL